MKHFDIAHNIVRLSVAMVCLLVPLTVPAMAQSGTPRPAPVGRRIDELNRQSENLEREALRRDLERGLNKTSDQKRSPAITAQVNEDFAGLQAVYNQIVLAMSANEALDYKFISVATADIKKRASRLKNNLALPQPKNNEPNQKKKSEISDGRIQNMLLVLRGHILSFATNPLFETLGPLDIELASKAGHDLGKIVELSETIRKLAERLRKADH